MISKLYVAHQEGQKNAGFDIEVRDTVWIEILNQKVKMFHA